MIQDPVEPCPLTTPDQAADPAFGVIPSIELPADARSGSFATSRLASPEHAAAFSATRLASTAEWDAMDEDAMALISNETRSSALERLLSGIARDSGRWNGPHSGWDAILVDGMALIRSTSKEMARNIPSSACRNGTVPEVPEVPPE